jgi:hypothetical protein
MKPDVYSPSTCLLEDTSEPNGLRPRRAVLEKLSDSDLLASCRGHARERRVGRRL